MNHKTDKVIQIILGTVFLFCVAAYLIFGQEWAKSPFYLTMSAICLYNLFFNTPGSGKE